MLAFGGIVIVIASVLCSLGIFGYIDLATTWLTIEVIPFLILAIGVDNLFICLHALQRLDLSIYSSSSDAVADALAEIGPSILLTSFSQAACFGIGTLTDIPAVHTFTLYATVAITFNFLLQITAFIAFLTIDLDRQQVSSFCTFFIRLIFKIFLFIEEYTLRCILLHQIRFARKWRNCKKLATINRSKLLHIGSAP